MLRLLGLHFKHVWKDLVGYLTGIMDGNMQNNQTLKNDSINKLIGFFVFRLIIWGIPGINFYIRGELEPYLFIVALIYVVGAVMAWAVDEPQTTPTETTNQQNALIEKRAREGLDVLLDYILLVVESLSDKTNVSGPKTKGQLAYPDKKRCVNVANGVAIVSVVLDYIGEMDTDKYLWRFNDRLGQMLNSGELPGHPQAVFTDKNNDPHTAIQAISCTAIKNQERIILEVIRVNQAAVALLDELDRSRAAEPDDRGQLYDDDL